jgi:putative PIN family toxin of toxin-antitoxin system
VRVVLDADTIVSGVIGSGPPRQLVDAAKRGDFELAMSPVLLAELLDVLGRAKFAARLTQAGLTPAGIVDDLRKLALLVTPPSVPRVVALDPDDDQVLACALAAGADLIVSETSAICCRSAAIRTSRSSMRARQSGVSGRCRKQIEHGPFDLLDQANGKTRADTRSASKTVETNSSLARLAPVLSQRVAT